MQAFSSHYVTISEIQDGEKENNRGWSWSTHLVARELVGRTHTNNGQQNDEELHLCTDARDLMAQTQNTIFVFGFWLVAEAALAATSQGI
jgi:hypothetical protein